MGIKESTKKGCYQNTPAQTHSQHKLLEIHRIDSNHVNLPNRKGLSALPIYQVQIDGFLIKMN